MAFNSAPPYSPDQSQSSRNIHYHPYAHMCVSYLVGVKVCSCPCRPDWSLWDAAKLFSTDHRMSSMVGLVFTETYGLCPSVLWDGPDRTLIFFFRLLLFKCSPLFLNIISQTAMWTHTCFPQHSCAVIRPWLTGLDKTGGFDVTNMYLSRSAQPTSLALISTAYWCSFNKVRAGAPVRTCPVRTETLGLWEDCWDLCF